MAIKADTMAVKIDQQQRRIITSMAGGLAIFKMLFGGIWLFVGGMGVYSLLTGGEITVNGRPGTPSDVWLPGIFAVIGFLIFFFRYRSCIDLSLNTVTSRWGFLLLMFGSSKPLAPIETVNIVKESRRTKNGSYIVYVVKLQLMGDEALDIDESRDKQSARRIAEDVAKLCDRSIQDASEGQVIERQVKDLDRRLIDAETIPNRRPPLPNGIERKEDGSLGAVLKLPSPPIGMRLAFTVVPLLMVVGFWWFAWYDPERGGSDKDSLFLTVFNFAPLLMFAVPAIGWIIKLSPTSNTVRVQNGELSVGRRKIPIAELEELVVTGKGLVANSDRTTIRFAQGCNNSQILGLREYLLYELHTNR